MSSNRNNRISNNETESSEEQPDDTLPPPRRSPGPVRLLVVLALVVVIVGGGFFAVRSLAGRSFAPAATPTPALPPGANLFYIAANPGWGTVSIDGHPIAHLPALGQAPLQLAAGAHEITWNAPPFPVQHCFVNVPPQPSGRAGDCDTSQSAKVVEDANAGQQATVITLAATSASLSSSQQAALTSATQAYMSAFQANDTVQPSELYASMQASHHIATAKQPLKAIVHFQLDTNPNSTQPCINYAGEGTPGCRINGLSCQTFCPYSTSQSNGSMPTSTNWQVYAVSQITWTYTTLSGKVVAQNEPNAAAGSSYEYIMPLSLTWNGSLWRVTNQQNVSPPAPFQFTTNPACAAAQDWITANPAHENLQGTTFDGQDTSVNRQYIAGANAASGCLIKNVLTSPSTAPVGYTLYRFGVLLAVNSAAHRYWPSLPMADSNEQHIAQQLLKEL